MHIFNNAWREKKMNKKLGKLKIGYIFYKVLNSYRIWS